MMTDIREQLRRLDADRSIMAWETGDLVELELYDWDGARVGLPGASALRALRGLPDGADAESVFAALEAAR